MGPVMALLPIADVGYFAVSFIRTKTTEVTKGGRVAREGRAYMV